MKNTTLNAKLRERSGKGAARQTRREGHIPSVIYGDKKSPVLISIEEKVITKEVRTPGFSTRLFEIAGAGADKVLSLCQGVQFDPVSDRVVHADFLRVGKDSEIRLHVPLAFKNELLSPGLKLGGVLNIVERTVEVLCKPDSIPENFEIDLTGLNIGDVIHTHSLKLPKGVELASEEDETLATIAPPTVEREEVKPAAADATAAAAAPAAGAAAPAAAGAAAKPDAKAAAKPEAKK